ncbi:MAG: N-acetylmuramoyl-L-alanine amidase [Byssovorax sp.]
MEAAEALVAGAPLPSRLEAVSIADAVALASLRQRMDGPAAGDAGARPSEGARLALLAADLRARLYRFDQTAADAREALELYAEAEKLARGTEAGCEADRQRALLAGELARDAAASYRELYLGSRRQAEVRAAGGPSRSPCLVRFDLALAQAAAYRPQGEAMRALEREGNAAAESARKGVAIAQVAPSGAPAEGSASPASSGEPSTPPSRDNLVVSPAESATPGGPVKLTSIEPFANEQGARIVLHLSAPTTFQVGTLGADSASGKDARVYLDIARAKFKGLAREQQVGGVVHRVRLGENGGGTRVVLDLKDALYRRVFYLPDPFRIVVDLSTQPPATADKPGDAAGGREVRRVAIDPGHGGNDSGAVGPTGLREKDVTLDIAHRVAPLLAHELKIETLLTRDNDTYIPLDLRAARANAFHADLFVSIHCNASENGKATGVQTFILDEAREGAAARVAARENAQLKRLAAVDDDKGQAELSFVLSNLNVGAMAARSRHVADLLQRSALASLTPRYPDTRDQGVKTAGFFVLVGADMPAVLFETAFISNTDDEARLGTADYRQKLADSIVNAIRAYKAGK